MKIYTKTGDKGETSLFGGERVKKDALRIACYGTVDELNSFIGMSITECTDAEVKELLTKIQNYLFVTGSDLATPYSERAKKLKIQRVPDEYITEMEQAIDKFSLRTEELKNFILPGGTKSSACLHICRTVCRRAERLIVSLDEQEEINKNIVIFVNRLSDLLFVLARVENAVQNTPDVNWKI